MNSKKLCIAIVAVAILIIVAQKSMAAIVVQDITDTEFNTLVATHEAAWSVVYRGGASSGGTSEEIRLARNTATPQPGGGDTLVGNLTWSNVNDLEILIDGSGNISARANSMTVQSLPIVRPFNQILVFLHDESIFDSTSLTGLNINTFIARNMTIDGFGAPGLNDVISITGFGSQAPLDFNLIWSPGAIPIGDEQFVQIVALQNATIPEPSTVLLLGMISLGLLRRKR